MDDISDKLSAARAALRDEYRADHADPWIIGFPGGKDSTLLLHLVVEMMLPGPRIASSAARCRRQARPYCC